MSGVTYSTGAGLASPEILLKQSTIVVSSETPPPQQYFFINKPVTNAQKKSSQSIYFLSWRCNTTRAYCHYASFRLDKLIEKRESLFSGVERKSRTAREQKRALQGHKTTALMAALKKGQKRWCTFLRLFFSRSDNDLCSLIWSLWA